MVFRWWSVIPVLHFPNGGLCFKSLCKEENVILQIKTPKLSTDMPEK
jgi:hypothetical protein